MQVYYQTDPCQSVLTHYLASDCVTVIGTQLVQVQSLVCREMSERKSGDSGESKRREGEREREKEHHETNRNEKKDERKRRGFISVRQMHVN